MTNLLNMFYGATPTMPDEVYTTQGGGFTQIFNKIAIWVADFRVAGSLVIVAIGILMIVIPMIIGTQQQKEQAKNRIFGFIIGTVVLLLLFNIVGAIGNNLRF